VTAAADNTSKMATTTQITPKIIITTAASIKISVKKFNQQN
jgi:hypothetical protein